MSEQSVQARRYAQAVLHAMLEKWDSAINQVSEIIRSDRSLATKLHDSNLSAADKAKALDAALPENTPDEVANLVKLLAQDDELELLPDIASALAAAVTGQRTPQKAEIVSAVELSDEAQAQIRDKLTQEHGEGLVFSFQVNPALLGGLRVRVGDHLTDTSVASRLATLRESLTSAVR